jgi:hypothetical protein
VSPHGRGSEATVIGNGGERCQIADLGSLVNSSQQVVYDYLDFLLRGPSTRIPGT